MLPPRVFAKIGVTAVVSGRHHIADPAVEPILSKGVLDVIR